MAKHYTKAEKLEVINFYYQNSWSSTIKYFSLDQATLGRWLKEYKILGEYGLEPGNGIQAKGTKRKGRTKSLKFNEMSIYHIPIPGVNLVCTNYNLIKNN